MSIAKVGTHCDEPMRLGPITKLRTEAHRTGWRQGVHVEVRYRCEWGQVKPHPAQIEPKINK